MDLPASLTLRKCLLVAWSGVFGFPTGVIAQESPGIAVSDDWKFDRIVLLTGKELLGVIVAEEENADIEFAEVRRSPGKPLNLVIRPVARQNIATSQKLNKADREQLRNRLNQYIHRAAIESRQMDGLKLDSYTRDGIAYHSYQGNWFWLESTADESVTRRAIVRVEQIFTAYRQILPPRRSPQRRLKILLFGDNARYATFLQGLGLEIDNPAFFAADFNIVAAGSDANGLQDQLDKARRENAAARVRLDEQLSLLPARLATLSEQMRKNGIPESDRKAVLAAEQRAWQDRRQKLLDEIARSERRNEQTCDAATREMFSRLYHEAFHAYLNNYVYPHHEFEVPRWLNEGLALCFESGQLEAGTLRFDAPNRRALVQLKAELQSAKPMPLAELLKADAEQFLSVHSAGEGKASTLYAYSWGLAYYLAFEKGLIGANSFENFVAPSKSSDIIARFETWTGMPLAEFEAKWRAAILAIK